LLASGVFGSSTGFLELLLEFIREYRTNGEPQNTVGKPSVEFPP
jgi:hypothetical protein